jgi:hypothetical protein
VNSAQNDEMDKFEGEQPNCHFTINEGDARDAASSRVYGIVTFITFIWGDIMNFPSVGY